MTRTAYDSVTPANLPAGGAIYPAYANGNYTNQAEVESRFPGVPVPGIDVLDAGIGIILDVESGDATPQSAPHWVVERRAAGVNPTVYCSESIWQTVINAFNAAGVPQPNYWVAAYPGGGAFVPGGAVAHQYEDTGPYDISVVLDYWPGVDPVPNPLPIFPKASSDMAVACPTGGSYAVRSDGGVFAYGGAGFFGSLPGLTPPVVVDNIIGIAPTKTGKGYWLAGSDGGVFSFGDAIYHGSAKGNPSWNVGTPTNPVVGLATDENYNEGYIIFADNGGASPSTYYCNEINSYT